MVMVEKGPEAAREGVPGNVPASEMIGIVMRENPRNPPDRPSRAEGGGVLT